MRRLGPVMHGYLDYALGPLFLVAPMALALGDTPRRLCWGLAMLWLALSLLTRIPLAMVRVLPFRVHAVLELALAPLLLAAPWLFGFADERRGTLFFLAAGAGLGLLWLATDYRANARARHRLRDERARGGGGLGEGGVRRHA
jgi:hypothetical protein